MNIISSKLHSSLYFWSLVIFAVSIHWSHSMTVIMTTVVGVLWLIQPNFKTNILVLFKKPSILLFSTIFFLSIISLPFTKNIGESLNYTKLLLPIFVLALFIGTSEKLSKQKFAQLMFCYVLSTVISSIFNLIYFSVNYSSITDIRLISFFMSHIRYSLFINIAIFTCFYYLFVEKIRHKIFTPFLLLSLLWLIIFIFILQSVTGVVILLIIFFFITCIKIYRSKRIYIRIVLISGVIIVLCSFSWNFLHIIHEFSNVKKIDPSKVDKVTTYGNPYTFRDDRMIENGNYVYYYVCESELRETWNSLSKVPYDGIDKKNEGLSNTLIRYLTSKNLRKDRNGVLALTADDRKNIENGITNYKLENKFSLNTRVYQIVWELDSYLHGSNPSGKSISQRFEFWRCAINLISENFFFGIGTGNVQKSLNENYKNVETKLSPDKWFFPHNQYLTIMIRFGFIGLLIFLVSIFAVVLYEKKQRDFFVFVLIAIVLMSMINEDTLETQYGIILFAFWGALFLFGRSDNTENSLLDCGEESPLK